MRRYRTRRGCWRPADGEGRARLEAALAVYPVTPYALALFRYLMTLATREGTVSGYTEASIGLGLRWSARSVRRRLAELMGAGMVTADRRVEARPGAGRVGLGLGPNGYQLQPPSAWVLRPALLTWHHRRPPYTDTTGSAERDATAAEDARLELARERMRAADAAPQ